MYWESRMNKKNTICAGIVSFNPELQRLQENVNAIKRNGISHIVIVDNGSENYAETYKRFEPQGILFVPYQENKGIAYALNQIFDTAIRSFDSEWVLTMDQDSVVDDSMIDCYLPYLDKPGIASLSSLYRERSNGNICGIGNVHSSDETIQIDSCITSGNLVNVKAWCEIGGFDNRLFIDMVDHEFCYRLRMRGYIILRINKPLMLHELGHQAPIKWLGKTCYVDNYSAIRNYYYSRNFQYVLKYYSQYAGNIRKTDLLRRFIKILIYEESKYKKLNSILRGISDARKMKKADFIPWNLAE